MRPVNFLGSGPVFSLTLQDEGRYKAPALNSVLDWGAGGRSVGAYPVDDPSSEGFAPFNNPHFIVESFRQTDSGYIQVLGSTKDPLTWIIRWRVGAYEIATHVRDVDGKDTVDLVQDEVSWHIVEETGLPMAVVSGSVRLVAAEFPGFQEDIVFQGDDPQGHAAGQLIAFALVRPSSLKQGDVLKNAFTDGKTTVSRAGLGLTRELRLVSLGSVDDVKRVGEVDTIVHANVT